jgi:diaminopimelate epimerase
MQENISFTKMHAIGNDFVILDRIKQNFKVSPELIINLANRHRGIGCDQVLVIEPPTHAECDFEYRIFNSDGGEVEQCGNGARCVGRYLYQKGLTDKKNIRLHTLSGVINVDVQNSNHIKVKLGNPTFKSKHLNESHSDLQKVSDNRYKLAIYEDQKEFSFVSLGNPHCVLFVPSLSEPNLNDIAKDHQEHPCFPESVNVIFVQVLAKNHIRCRVFERNTGETQACGSGACAAAIAGIQKDEVNQNVQVDMPGGSLEVEWEKNSEVILGGGTNAPFEGTFWVSQAWLAQTEK